jgi:uncharacterized membrane protein YhiD involved in acid resistance
MPFALIEAMRHMLAALAAGAVIGTERSFHGHAAGFRTHALVGLASSIVMVVGMSQAIGFPGAATDAVRTDPARLAQGIMTGVGFLGAGVIFKEGLTVRGLTTAASIWTTAAIGILMGEYRMAIRTVKSESLRQLAETLTGLPSVRGFSLEPSADY